jgi:hypothetical protein
VVLAGGLLAGGLLAGGLVTGGFVTGGLLGSLYLWAEEVPELPSTIAMALTVSSVPNTRRARFLALEEVAAIRNSLEIGVKNRICAAYALRNTDCRKKIGRDTESRRFVMVCPWIPLGEA